MCTVRGVLYRYRDLLKGGSGFFNGRRLLLRSPRQIIGRRLDFIGAGINARGIFRYPQKRVLQFPGRAVEVAPHRIELLDKGIVYSTGHIAVGELCQRIGQAVDGKADAARLIGGPAFPDRTLFFAKRAVALRLLFQRGLLSIVFAQNVKRAGKIADLVPCLDILQCQLKISLRNLGGLIDDVGDAPDEPPRDEPSRQRQQHGWPSRSSQRRHASWHAAAQALFLPAPR